ncbi:MAG: NAD(+)/NADH kinase [Anaerovoracaceae bacterium]
MMRKINLFTNGTAISKETQNVLTEKLKASGFSVDEQYSEDCELLVCIGGDGTLLEAVHTYDFPNIPLVGINTGHLGFFQEVSPDNLDTFIEGYNYGKYTLQPLNTVKATVTTQSGKKQIHRGLNEIVIKGKSSYSVHLNISIGASPIERFSGDGIVVATSAGSTAYNYSLGGSIVDPRLKLLQVTPMAPMNTTAYRSFTSSMLLPSDLSLDVIPEYPKDNHLFILNDGIETDYVNVSSIKVEFSEKVVNLLRFESYDFWDKVKSKFL